MAPLWCHPYDVTPTYTWLWLLAFMKDTVWGPRAGIIHLCLCIVLIDLDVYMWLITRDDWDVVCFLIIDDTLSLSCFESQLVPCPSNSKRMCISRYRLLSLKYLGYTSWLSAWRLCIKWYVRLQSNDQLKMCIVVNAGRLKKNTTLQWQANSKRSGRKSIVCWCWSKHSSWKHRCRLRLRHWLRKSIRQE